MIIMEKDATSEQIKHVVSEIKKHGLRADISRGEFRTIIGLVGDESRISFAHLAALPGVKEARMVETPYKLISREYSERGVRCTPFRDWVLRASRKPGRH